MNLSTLIKITLVGDYSIFRSALRHLLETKKNFQVINEFSKISETANINSNLKPDLILVDLPDNGETSDLFSFLLQTAEKIPIVVLTGSDDAQIYQKCLKSGISGLVRKDKSSAVLFKSIEKVYEGEFWFDRNLLGHAVKELVSEKQMLRKYLETVHFNGLTERENQVVNLICKGMKNKEIAGKLFITETTVRHHLTSIFEKFSLTNRLGVSNLCFQAQIG